jgi:hypothetical protein
VHRFGRMGLSGTSNSFDPAIQLLREALAPLKTKIA